MSRASIEPWMEKVAESIVKNVVQYWKDYRATNCVSDVSQEIATAYHNRAARPAQSGSEGGE